MHAEKHELRAAPGAHDDIRMEPLRLGEEFASIAH